MIRWPMVDVAGMIEEDKAMLMQAIERVLARGDFILGKEVSAFEDAFAEYLGVCACVGVNSGTDALEIALAALGIGPGDEVITTPFTFAATAEVIVRLGAKPVFVDICRQDFNIDAEAIEAAITPRTRAIVPVHLFGQPAEMARISEIARAHGLFVIEDCAQAAGASLDGKKCGAWGNAAGFSFFPSKNLSGLGDGGMIAFADEQAASRARALRNHGQYQRYRYEMIGTNSRLDTLQAACLLARLDLLDARNQARAKVAAYYDELLSDAPVVRQKAVRGVHVWHQYTVLLSEGVDRGKVQQGLRVRGVASAVYYPYPLYRQPAYAAFAAHCPVAEEVALRCLSLPMHPRLTKGDCAAIAHALKDVLAACGA